ncbi:MAG: bifunctional pyr operon transcriptional regulator/uracil phosphoribosyltransferase PyrR [Chitinophagaceae bacterium]
MKEILNHTDLQIQIASLANALLKKHPQLDDVVFVGIQQGGVVLADDIVAAIQLKQPDKKVQYGQLDITFYRDDIRKEILAPDTMHLPFSIENKNVVLIDDVLFTGRTIKAALDVLLDYGRPAKVELCVLVDRKEHRQFPIQADFSAIEMATDKSDKVKLIKDSDNNKHVVLMPKG